MALLVSDVDITPSSTAVNEPVASTARLFAALDGIRIDDPVGGWITEVLGIHAIRPHLVTVVPHCDGAC
jgi:hypothetical protein